MIATALRAVADDIEARATSTTWDAHRQPTEEQKAAMADKVRAVARDVRALADDAETRTVRYVEFDVLRGGLYALGYDLTPKLVENVAIAIRDAKGPAEPLKQGWLNRPCHHGCPDPRGVCLARVEGADALSPSQSFLHSRPERPQR